MKINEILPNLDTSSLSETDKNDLSLLLISSIEENELVKMSLEHSGDGIYSEFKEYIASKVRNAISFDEMEDNDFDENILEKLG